MDFCNSILGAFSVAFGSTVAIAVAVGSGIAVGSGVAERAVVAVNVAIAVFDGCGAGVAWATGLIQPASRTMATRSRILR